MHLFKVWTKGGEQKAFITIAENENIYKNLILQASKKLGINGYSLVLQSDGTPVTEDEVLLLIKKETLILLEKDEVYGSQTSDLCAISTIENSGIINVSDNYCINPDFNINMNSQNKENMANISNEEQNEPIIQVIGISHEEDFNWIDYKVPWDKVPLDMLKTCEEGVTNKSVITEICHIIVNDIRQIKKNVPTQVLKKIASEMILKYPKTFMDKDEDGHILGDGSCTMFHKLRERCCYLKRIESKRSAEKSGTIQSKERKLHVMAGCSNYENLPPHTSTSTTNEDNCEETYDEESFQNMMERHYIEQRKFLENFQNPPSLNDIKEKFPILFQLKSIIFHFNKLTSKKLEDLPRIMEEKSIKIVEYAIQNKFLKLNNNEDYCIQSLRFFTLYFKEDFGKIFYKIKDDNINIAEKLQINAPCIVAIVSF
ncbi:PREDICTED: uncharacterized protein LOC105556237 [Vollenhovia emeryi]|uniref:uncharacterized protein LOC105556237 n=1 Tax=Vollenhovia emeryi TaxID=411798 RepID=UPI0005F5485C|nr:PREDICTED: uncharacterized protein LOC105556237 [Vollenhovia emeryi]